jgi:Ca2+-binding RTX toxin-like protein
VINIAAGEAKMSHTGIIDQFSNIQVFNGGGGDTFIGGPGNHVLNGMVGPNTLDYSSAATGVQFNIATGIAYNNFGGPTVTTDRFSNVQIFVGGSGNDVFYGGPGNHVFDGSDGTNTLDYSAASGNVRVNLLAGKALNGYGGTDYFDHMQFLRGGASHNDFSASNVTGSYTFEGGGTSDTFSFGGAFGNGTIADFAPGADLIYLASNQFADFAAVQSHAAQVGGSTVITLDSSNSITLRGVALASLNASEFRFL